MFAYFRIQKLIISESDRSRYRGGNVVSKEEMFTGVKC
jgi:hypothetical protein